MTQLIEVAFKGNRKDFFLWDADHPPALKTPVIVEADRGDDLGYVHAVGELAQVRNAGTPHGYGTNAPPKSARRVASSEDVRRANALRTQDDDTRRRAMECVRAHQLVMKLTDAEWQWDRKKLTLYFTAEKRVDFRALVRELAAMFRTRIELKQIGVRDEAKRLDGVGRCGRQYCSAAWLPELRPVNLGVAKDQRLSLNPSQISGACGRLMCCLRYEHDFYVSSRRRFPKEGRTLKTARGDERVIANDIFRDRVTLKGVDGELHVVPLAELRQELDAVDMTMPTDTSVSDEGGTDWNDEEITFSPVVVAEASALDDVPAEAADPAQAPSDERQSKGERRRRRGRRGGRRNRPGGVADRGSSDESPPRDG